MLTLEKKPFRVLDTLFEGGLGLLLLFSPLLIAVGNIDAYRTVQATFSLVLILFLVTLWGIRLSLADSWRRVLTLPAALPLLLFLGWSALSLTQSPSLALGGQSLLALCAYALLYLAIADRAREGRFRDKLPLLILVPFSINAILGILQFLHFDIQGLARILPPSLFFQNYVAGLNAPSRLGSAAGILGNQDVLGWYLVGPLSLLVGLFLARWKSLRSVPYALLFGIGLVCLFATMTRGAWIGMGVAMLLMASLLYFRFRAFVRKNRLFILIGVLAFSLLAMGGAFSVGVTPRSMLTRATGDNHTMLQRLDVWKVAKRMADERPMLGQGLGSFKVLYFSTLTRQFPDSIPPILRHRYVQAHNDFLQALAETGYLGFLLLLFALGWFYADRIRCLKGLPGNEGIMGIGELGALTAILAGGLSGFPFHIAVSSVVFVVLAGSLAARGERGIFERISHDSPKKLFLGIEGAGIALLGLTLAASVLLQYQADLFTKQGMEMVSRQDFPAAETLLVRALSCDGARGDARVQLGYSLAMQHRWDPAARVIEASLSTFDDVSTHYYLGFIYRSLGKFLDSRREYLRAISYYPEGHPTRTMILGQLQALDRYVAQGYEKKTTLEGGSPR